MTALWLGLALLQAETRVDITTVVAGGVKDTRIRQAEEHRFTEADGFRALWKRHAGTDAKAPDVDFEKEFVIAVFYGAGKIQKLQIQAATTKDAFFVRYSPHFDCIHRGGDSELNAFFIVRIPRTELKIVLQRGTGDKSSGYGKLETVREFSAVKK